MLGSYQIDSRSPTSRASVCLLTCEDARPRPDFGAPFLNAPPPVHRVNHLSIMDSPTVNNVLIIDLSELKSPEERSGVINLLKVWWRETMAALVTLDTCKQ